MNVSPAAPAPKGVDHPVKRRNLGTAKEVAELLRWPLTSLYDNTRAGRIPGAIRIGRRIMYDLDKLDAWLEAGGDYSRTGK